MSKDYNVPEGAKPWVPEDVMAAAAPVTKPEASDEPTPKRVDTSRTVAGIVTGLDESPADVSDEVKPEQVIDLKKGEEEAEEPSEASETRICLACGSMLNLNDEVEISDEDKTRWLRHVLGEDKFRQTYTVFNGRMEVTFRSRTTEENDMLFKQMTHELNTNTMPDEPYFSSPAYAARLNRLMLILSLERVVKHVDLPSGGREARPTVYPPVTAENYNNKGTDYHTPLAMAHEQILSKLDESFVAILMTLLRRFDVTTTMLVMRSSDPDFWETADDGR